MNSTRDIINRIRALDIPARAKAELFIIYSRAREVVIKILAWIEAHKEFCDAILLGAIVAFLLHMIPWIGGFLALLALVSSAAVGLMLEIRQHLTSLFEAPQQG